MDINAAPEKPGLELAGFISQSDLISLPGMPGKLNAVNKWGKDKPRKSKQELGLKGKGWMYPKSCLPPETQKYLDGLQFKSSLSGVIQESANLPSARQETVPLRDRGIFQGGDQFTDRQLATADAQAVVLLAIDHLRSGLRYSQQKAIEELNASYMAGTLPDELRQAMESCNAKSNADRAGKLSLKTVNNWRSLKKERGNLIPKVRQKDYSIPAWGTVLLARYRQPQRPTLKAAFKDACEDLKASGWQEADLPSYFAVNRFKNKLSPLILERGRATGAAWKALLPFVRRDWDGLNSNDVWVGDGHTFKAKVQHPDHGRPFAPEVTLIIDASSRFVVGWSVSLSENCIAVSESLGYGLIRYGKPLIYYSDNGAGQTAKILDAPVTGLMARMGIDHQTGIPGNPQGRGLIERIWGTLMIPLAKTFPTCQAKTTDRDALNKIIREINSAKTRGEVPNYVPSWKQFIDELERVINGYNASHEHRSLGGKTPAEVYAANLDPLTAMPLTENEKRDLYRPEVERSTSRGEVSLFNNIYFLRDLTDLPAKTKVRVAFDIHDPNKVWVKDLEGRYLGEAVWDGNKRDGFPKPYIQELKEKRVAGIVNRAQEKAKTAHLELVGTIEQEAMESVEADFMREIEEREAALLEADANNKAEADKLAALPLKQNRPVFMDDVEQLEWLAANPQEFTAKDKDWIDWMCGKSDDFYRLYTELFWPDGQLKAVAGQRQLPGQP